MDLLNLLKKPQELKNKLDAITRGRRDRCPKCKDTGRDHLCICNCGCPEAKKHLEAWKKANNL